MLGDASRRRQPGPFRDHSSTAQARVHEGALALERPGRRPTRGGARPRRPRGAPGVRRPSIRPAVWSLLKGNLCLAGALLKAARPRWPVAAAQATVEEGHEARRHCAGRSQPPPTPERASASARPILEVTERIARLRCSRSDRGRRVRCRQGELERRRGLRVASLRAVKVVDAVTDERGLVWVQTHNAFRAMVGRRV